MLQTLLDFYLVFVKIGFCSFGGLSMIPVINEEMVSHGWMTLSEVTDIIAIAEMTPGPLGVNAATFAGISWSARYHEEKASFFSLPVSPLKAFGQLTSTSPMS